MGSQPEAPRPAKQLRSRPLQVGLALCAAQVTGLQLLEDPRGCCSLAAPLGVANQSDWREQRTRELFGGW